MPLGRACSIAVRGIDGQIVEIEAEKSGLAANDPRLGALGREAEGLAARMARTTKVQSALVDVARDEASRDEAAQRGPGG